jgi:L-histidine N-alpha-methyltransferase
MIADDVSKGLCRTGQKTLPSSLLYDAVGSALFEVITVLPEYGLTRADAALLGAASEEIIALAGNPRRVVELGSGSGSKTRFVLQAAARTGPIQYLPIDISSAALAACAATLADLEHVCVQPVEAGYLEGVGQALSERNADERTMVLFLGSTIGNFAPAEAIGFLRDIRGKMREGDSLLLGADLIKPREQLLEAYDDPLGVTASFNLNLLARINRELGGEFVLSGFSHEARFDECHSRVEMHLRSGEAQQVRIGTLGVTVSFDAGETIWTESSHKFRQEDIARMGEEAGWKMVQQWVDREWGFAESLFHA